MDDLRNKGTLPENEEDLLLPQVEAARADLERAKAEEELFTKEFTCKRLELRALIDDIMLKAMENRDSDPLKSEAEEALMSYRQQLRTIWNANKAELEEFKKDMAKKTKLADYLEKMISKMHQGEPPEDVDGFRDFLAESMSGTSDAPADFANYEESMTEVLVFLRGVMSKFEEAFENMKGSEGAAGLHAKQENAEAQAKMDVDLMSKVGRWLRQVGIQEVPADLDEKLAKVRAEVDKLAAEQGAVRATESFSKIVEACDEQRRLVQATSGQLIHQLEELQSRSQRRFQEGLDLAKGAESSRAEDEEAGQAEGTPRKGAPPAGRTLLSHGVGTSRRLAPTARPQDVLRVASDDGGSQLLASSELNYLIDQFRIYHRELFRLRLEHMDLEDEHKREVEALIADIKAKKPAIKIDIKDYLEPQEDQGDSKADAYLHRSRRGAGY